ncbi:T9SS type A sorting domain-containing protein [Spirosoma taeanense]|uniref:T9SS type A sorting domain-containing protein n=2 Tax=Spirosoma taeanense TaxID=2735870 RepID=A0A6M5YEP3_9BACT|nr:T9SS type A sorting domain-containing protein [Spirosoma taeanense]
MNSSKQHTADSWRSIAQLITACFLFIAYGLLPRAYGQINTWRSHVSYRSGQSVAVAGNNVYAATQNGFFYVDKSTNETVKLSKDDGLSDVGISRLLYLTDQNRLLLAYRNGNLDFLTLTANGQPDGVKNLSTIVTATNLPASVSRTVNHLNRIGNNVYLSTDFGLVVLDVLKDEIRDTFFSRRTDNGSPLPIFQTAATTDSLYALTFPTTIGGYRNNLQAIRLLANINIADPANWRSITLPGATNTAPGAFLTSLLVVQNRLLASAPGQGIFERQNNNWVLTQPLNNQIVQLFRSGNNVVVATEKAITLPGSGTFTGSLLTDPREVEADGNRVWVADAQSGLLVGNAGTFERIVPDGPTRDQFARLYTYPQTLVALPNGPMDVTSMVANQPSAELLSVPDNRWTSIVTTGGGFNAAAYLSAEQTLYLGSRSGGLWRQANGQSPVAVTLPATISPFISNLAADFNGNLWITTSDNTRQANLHVRRPDGTFQSFPAVSQTNIQQIEPDDTGFLWLRLELGRGLLVFDPQTNRSRFLSTERGQGGLLSNTVRAMVKDRTGAIWVGTDLGPTVFDYPAGAFDASIDAQPPLINRRRLLANELITSLAVDGGNRKWIGTQNALYYVAPDGSQLLNTFTVDNSPLPNNLIQALAIEPVSGEVFIQTPNGLVSYRGPATEPALSLSGLTIFPNPVRPDFSGVVGINGLTGNATVKILDAGGQLVYETRSQGGTATWNLQDYRGRSAQTGIYLVVVVAADGTTGLAGKLAVVR